MAGFIENKSAIKILYYLVLADGTVQQEEESLFEKIALRLDENFEDSRTALMAECVKTAKEGGYQAVEAAVGAELEKLTGSEEEGISPRTLVWNMLLIACISDGYCEEESALVTFTAEKLGIGNDLRYELEKNADIVITAQSKLKELEETERPYKEIRPMAEDIERQRDEAMDAAKKLIAEDSAPNAKAEKEPKSGKSGKSVFDDVGSIIDDVLEPVKIVVNDLIIPTAKDIMDSLEPAIKDFTDSIGPKAREVKDTVGPAVKEWSSKVKPMVKDAEERITPVAKELSEEAMKQLSDAKDKIKEKAPESIENIKSEAKKVLDIIRNIK